MNLVARVACAYLLNSMWQMPVLYLVGLVLERNARQTSVETRHRLWVLVFTLQALLPAICLVPLASFARSLQVLLSFFGLARQNESATVSFSVGAGRVAGQSMTGHVLLPALLAMYAGWSFFCCGRLAYQLWQIHTLRKRSRAVQLPAAALERWQQLCARFEVAAAELQMSSGVSVPVTIGFRHKLLLVPAWFAELPLAQMEIAFAHELAHMQRYDFAKNLLYEFLALPGAYNPFLNLTRRRLAESREMVCDAQAAEALSGRAAYARALLRLAAVCASAATPVTLPQAIGIFGANTLERRLMSLKAGRREVSFKHRFAFFTLSGAIVIGTCGSALALRIGVPQAQNATQGTRAAGEQSVQVPSNIMAQHTMSKVPPVYPAEAKQAHIMGSVVLSARVGADGHIEKLTAISGPPELQASAITAVQQWVYEPYVLNGSPVAVDTTVTINYQLNP